MPDPAAAPHEPTNHDVTMLLQAIGDGDDHAAARLLPLVYDELRKLAHARMNNEAPGQTLQPTALVHEAYMRLVDAQGRSPRWDGRGHFFGAAALAMRRILVERARHRNRIKHGGGRKRVDLEDADAAAHAPDGTDLVALDEALQKLEKLDKRKHDVVMLRYFAGLSIEEAAGALALSPATVKTEWSFARAWLRREMAGAEIGESAGSLRGD
ncbi:MAG: sigma-70 family RNA polymerase sigma factor [Planctomycetes bacterium]|nr:sigma-70 family RNA polymerase sigma factor [Planctomycetota bacterium]